MKQWVADLLALQNLDMKIRNLQTRLETIPGIRCVKNEGTYLMFLDCRELHMPQAELDRLLGKENTK